MSKNFQHRDKWFIIFKDRQPDWIGSGYALHVPENIDTLKDNVEMHTFYVEKDNTLWQISLADLLKHRQKYVVTGKWHIDRDFLTPIGITEEWRKEINKYKRHKKHG